MKTGQWLLITSLRYVLIVPWAGSCSVFHQSYWGKQSHYDLDQRLGPASLPGLQHEEGRGGFTAQLHVSAASHKADRSKRGMRIERCTDSSLTWLKVGCDRLLFLSEQHRIKLKFVDVGHVLLVSVLLYKRFLSNTTWVLMCRKAQTLTSGRAVSCETRVSTQVNSVSYTSL